MVKFKACYESDHHTGGGDGDDPEELSESLQAFHDGEVYKLMLEAYVLSVISSL